jgi:magnesium transporter
VWVDLEEPDAALLTELAGCFGLHPLVAEDIVERNQRSKIERTEETLHIVAFELRLAADLELVEIDLVLGHGFLLSSHERGWQPFEVAAIKRDPAEVLRAGADHVLWALTDALVDSYFPVFDALGDAIEALQDDVIAHPGRAVLERLFEVRRSLLLIRHAVSPQREVFNQLTNRLEPLIAPERLIYFRDVYDHLIRLTDELDSYRELVSTTVDAYLTVVNNNLSEIMKRLTAVTVIVAGVGAVAGIFGMSEAGAAFSAREAIGFWLVTAGVLGLGAVALLYFRRIDWL